MMVWGEGRKARGASRANESHNSFHGNTTASHVLFEPRQRAVDLLFPVEPANHSLLSSGQLNSLVTSSSHKSLLHEGFTNAFILQSSNTLLIKLALKELIFPQRVISTWLKPLFQGQLGPALLISFVMWLNWSDTIKSFQKYWQTDVK